MREATGGIPIGFKMSAQHIEEDLDFALQVGVDYVILDGRGGATGAAPDIFKNNISVPTMASAGPGETTPGRAGRARRHPDHHRGPAHRVGLREGPGARSRRRGDLEFRPAGNRLPRNAGMPHEQLSGGHSDAEPLVEGKARRRGVGKKTGQLPGGDRRADGSTGPGLRSLEPGQLRFR